MSTFEDHLRERIEALHDALKFAFRRLAEFDRFLQFRMHIPRSERYEDAGVSEIIFLIINDLDAEGRLGDLLIQSLKFKPGSPKLLAFASQCPVNITPPALLQLLPNASSPIAGPSAIAAVPSASHASYPTQFDAHQARRALCEAAVAVGRIEQNSQPCATGFLVGPDLLLTCEYVVNMVANPPAELSVVFPVPDRLGWRLDRRVGVATHCRAAFSPQSALDYVLIRLAEPVGMDDAGYVAAKRGWLTLAANSTEPQSLITILHYAYARDLSISFVSGLPSEKPTRLYYQHATAPGSGGAPCLGRDLSVVALHEMGHTTGQRAEGVSALDIRQDLIRQGVTLTPPAT